MSLLRTIGLPVTLLTIGVALAFRLAITYLGLLLLLLGLCIPLWNLLLPLSFFKEEEEPFSSTCKLLLWPMIPSAAWSSFNNSANE